MIVAQSIIEKTLEEALSTGADFAEIFIEDSYSSVLSLMDSSPKNSTIGRNHGAGIRIHFGTEEIYVTTNDLSEAGLIRAARGAAQARPGGERKVKPQALKKYDQVLFGGKFPWEVDRGQKIQFLKALDSEARRQSTLVTQVEPALVEKVQKVQIANSFGAHVVDQRQNFRTTLSTYVEEGGAKETFSKNKYSTTNPLFFEQINVPLLAKETVESAIAQLKADYAPAGEMPVVIDNGFGGVIFHEACGHGLETTSVAPGASVFCGKLGEQIAQSCVTAIDDGTIEGEWGSLKYDDEGSPTQKTVLIENGILKSYMVDRLGSKKTGFLMTGSGRRESYKYAPTSRMRNTFIAPGDTSLESMIADIDFGIYAKDMGGGSVTPGTGDFNFAVREAFIIRNGKISEPVKGASLIGRGIEALGKITKVGKDLQHASGMCGSVSGSIPAAVGQPAVLVSKILVGGRAK